MIDGKPNFHVPVLIVGAGPVGLALAIELGLRGVNCLIVDETDGLLKVPTANYLNCRTVEFLRRWGIADEVRYRSFPSDYPNNILYLTGLNGHELVRFERPANGASDARWSVSPEGPLWCPKAYFDPVLRRKVTEIPSVRLRFGCRLESFHQTDNCVVAQLVDVASQGYEQITADYLIGCDGGRSSIRHQLGIELQGHFAQHRQLLVWFKAPLLKYHRFGPAVLNWILKPDGFALLSALDGGETWRTGPWLSQGEEADKRTAQEWVRLIIGDNIPFEVLGSGYWGGHYAVAERYRHKRVFLAGDATHLLTPAGALGMNTGIGDAVDLGWKLAATFEGWAGSGLLDSYERERRPIALQNISGSSNLRSADEHFELSENLDADTEEGERLRQQLGKLLAESPRGLEFRTGIPGIVLGYSYEDSPICVTDGTPDQPLDPNAYTPSARPGARAPHAWLDDGQSTLDLFGRGFTLLRLDNQAPDTASLEGAAQELGLPLQVIALERPEILDLYERRLVLVRPDGHVAWRSDEVPANPETLLNRIRGSEQ